MNNYLIRHEYGNTKYKFDSKFLGYVAECIYVYKYWGRDQLNIEKNHEVTSMHCGRYIPQEIAKTILEKRFNIYFLHLEEIFGKIWSLLT